MKGAIKRQTKKQTKKMGSPPQEPELVAEAIIDAYDGAEDTPPTAKGEREARGEECTIDPQHAKAQPQQEIAEHEQDQEALQTTARYLQSLIEKSSDGILVIDSNGAPSYRYLPIAFEDIHRDDLQRAINSLRQIAGDPGAKVRTEVRVRHKDGSWRYAEVTGANYLHDPEVNGMILCFRDITDHNRSEEQLRTTARYLQSLIERSSDGIVVIDSNGVPSYRYIPIAFEDINRDDLQRAINSLRQIAEEPSGKVLTEVRVQHKDSSWRYAEVTGTNYLHDPEVKGMILSFRDITDRKHVEERLEAAHRELVQTAREAGMAEVATSVLHNVGNVVNSVGVAASSIQEKVRSSRVANLAKVAAMLKEHEGDLGDFLTTDERGQKLPEYISSLAQHLTDEQNKVNSEAETLLKHVQHVIEIINIQQSCSKTTGLTELVTPSEIMEDALRINEVKLTQYGVEVAREFEGLPAIMLDRHKTLQILTNLVSNATYAMSESEQPSKVLRLSIRKADDNHIHFEVADNGIGISEDNMARIFNYGFTTRKKGHGFGLHSGALAAKEMGGSLQCGSDGQGKGATFTLELPMVDKGEGSEH